MTAYEPPIEAVDVLARHMAHVTLDWTDVESGEHEHSPECANWRAYIADARRALTAAGPIIAAQALRGAADALDRDDMTADRWYAAWLRDHAASIARGETGDD